MASDAADVVRIFPLGEPIPDGVMLFEGSSVSARAFLRGQPMAARAELAVWTPGHIFTVEEFEAETVGHEHDPLSEA